METRALRGATVSAADQIVEAAGSTVTAYQLGQYLVAARAEAANVKALGFISRSTVAF